MNILLRRPRPGTLVEAQITVTRQINVVTFIDADGDATTEPEDIDIVLDVSGRYVRADPDCGTGEGFEDIEAFDADGESFHLFADEEYRAETALLRETRGF